MRPRTLSHRLAATPRMAWLLGATCFVGCAGVRSDVSDPSSEWIDPVQAAFARPVASVAETKSKSQPKTTAAADPLLSRTKAAQDANGSKGSAADVKTADLPLAIESASPPSPDAAELDAIAASGKPMTLQEAIETAFRAQPRLRAQLESITQAKGRQEIVTSAFLPTAGLAYSVGGFDLGVGGQPIRLGSTASPGFNFIPGLGALPVGFHVATGYELAELKVQWLICDFGRRLGRLAQAQLAIDIAQFQTDRAFQTVSNEVAVAYYNVLKSQAFRRAARDANRRAEENLEDAQKLEREGVVEREAVLRTEVLRAETRQQLHAATEAEFVALAELNLAIGLKCNQPVRVLEPPAIPPFELSLADCLKSAVQQRREFRVAQRTIEIAHEGTRVMKAEFAPKIIADGTLLDFQQSSPNGSLKMALGYIRLEWNIFEGGRRIAETHVANSRVREAMAQAESIADNIAFQVNESYRRVSTARLGIEDARPAVDQAREGYRLVRLRSREGNATPVEVTDAQATLTRAEQNYQTAFYAYLTAIARLEYAMGVTPTPATLASCRPLEVGRQ